MTTEYLIRLIGPIRIGGGLTADKILIRANKHHADTQFQNGQFKLYSAKVVDSHGNLRSLQRLYDQGVAALRYENQSKAILDPTGEDEPYTPYDAIKKDINIQFAANQVRLYLAHWSKDKIAEQAERSMQTLFLALKEAFAHQGECQNWVDEIQ